MNEKRTLYISVFGQPRTGKTTVVFLFKRLLDSLGIETHVSWGLDGPPREEPQELKFKAIAEKIKVVVTETQQRKGLSERHESPDDYLVRVYHTGLNYGVSVSVQGTVLTHNFIDRRDEARSTKERARSVAVRLAHELGVEVIDEIPNEYDYVQPR